MKIFLRLLVALLSLNAIPAQAQFANNTPINSPDYRVSPGGRIGPFAFSNWIWRVDDATITPDKINVSMSYRYLKDQMGSPYSAGVLNVEIPFSKFAQFELSYLVDHFNMNDDTFAALQPRSKSGYEVGDIIAGLKFKILNDHYGTWSPDIVIHGSIKTASGTFETNKQFTDSSGYDVDAAFAKVLYENPAQDSVLNKVKLLFEMGFMAYDDGAHSQISRCCPSTASGP